MWGRGAKTFDEHLCANRLGLPERSYALRRISACLRISGLNSTKSSSRGFGMFVGWVVIGWKEHLRVTLCELGEPSHRKFGT